MVELATDVEIEYDEIRRLEHLAENGGGCDILEATHSLGRKGAFGALKRLSSSEFARTRELAVAALGEFGDVNILPTLFVVAEADSDSGVRKKAQEGIESLRANIREITSILARGNRTAARDIESEVQRAREEKRHAAPAKKAFRLGGL